MKKVEFSKEYGNEVEVTVDGAKYGTIKHGYERDDEDHKNLVWVFWDAQAQEGVNYSDDLADTEETITDEIQNNEN